MNSHIFSYLALGDSYTLGEGVDPAESWPTLLARALTDSGLPTREPRVVARTGWTTDELNRGIDGAGVEGAFDLVSLLVGVNDQYRGRDLTLFETGLRKVLERAVGFAQGDAGRVMVLSIPDWGVTPHAQGRDREGIGVQIDAFNQVKKESARAAGAVFVDVTGISRETGAAPRFQAEDGLHPSGAMYARWLDAVLPVAVEILMGKGGGER